MTHSGSTQSGSRRSDSTIAVRGSILRTVAAIVIGYFTVAALTVLTSGLSWRILGPEGAFHEQSTVASTSWSLLSCVAGLVAAVCAGFIASRIGRHPRDLPVWGLAVFLLLFGLSYAIAMAGKAPGLWPEGIEISELTFQQAGQIASNPIWYLFAIPMVGALGVLLGGRLSRRIRTVQTTESL